MVQTPYPVTVRKLSQRSPWFQGIGQSCVGSAAFHSGHVTVAVVHSPTCANCESSRVWPCRPKMRCQESSVDLIQVVAHADKFCGDGTVLKAPVKMVDFHHY